MSSPRPASAPPAAACLDGPRPSGVVMAGTSATLDVAQVYAEHVRVVWRFLSSLGVRDADLEDLCQEVFLVVHRRLAEFDGLHPITTWLYAICLRVASAHRRKAHMRYERIVEDPPDFAVDATQTDDVARAEAQRFLRRALDALDEEKRAVFVLFELEMQPMTEVARAVGAPLQTAYARLYAARQQIERAAREWTNERSSP